MKHWKLLSPVVTLLQFCRLDLEKNLIFQLFCEVKLASNPNTCILVVAPLNSIVEDQINELTELGFTAVHLKENDPECMKDIAGGKFNLTFCCAERCLSEEFQCKTGLTACTSPTLRDICNIAVLCSVSRPSSRFIRVHEGHFMLCNKEEFQLGLSRKIVLWQIFIDVLSLNGFRCYLRVAS